MTELRGGAPWWLVRSGLDESTDPLPLRADVVVIGAGITGALISDRLSRAGLRVATVDRHALADGSTAASTALLMYGLDVELAQLGQQSGIEVATRAYRRTARAVADLVDLADDIGADVGLGRRSCLYLATARAHPRRLRAEADLRRQIGLDATWIPADELRDRYGIAARGAIRSSDAAIVNPVRLSRALFARARQSGATVTTRTTVTALASTANGVTVTTTQGPITARWCVAAMGYATPPGLRPQIVRLHSSYALASEPMADAIATIDDVVFWEASRPYLYGRTTTDGRLIIGGADLPFKDPDLRDAALPARRARLERQTRARLPAVALAVAESWSGTFAETADGLPCIGPVAEAPQILLTLCAGGNGIPFAMIAADLIAAHCHGRPDPDAPVFRLDRQPGSQ